MLVGSTNRFVRPSQSLRSGHVQPLHGVQTVPPAMERTSAAEANLPNATEISGRIGELLGRGGGCANGQSGKSAPFMNFAFLILFPLPTFDRFLTLDCLFIALRRVWFQQKAVRNHHVKLTNDLMPLMLSEPMLATLFKFVMPGLSWAVWNSLLDVEQFAKIEALIRECPSKNYVTKWCTKAQLLENVDKQMSFSDSTVLDTLSKTLHCIFCVSSSEDAEVDPMCSHRQKVCEDTITFLQYKWDWLLWDGCHSLDAPMSKGKEEYMIWKGMQ